MRCGVGRREDRHLPRRASADGAGRAGAGLVRRAWRLAAGRQRASTFSLHHILPACWSDRWPARVYCWAYCFSDRRIEREGKQKRWATPAISTPASASLLVARAGFSNVGGHFCRWWPALFQDVAGPSSRLWAMHRLLPATPRLLSLSHRIFRPATCLPYSAGRRQRMGTARGVALGRADGILAFCHYTLLRHLPSSAETPAFPALLPFGAVKLSFLATLKDRNYSAAPGGGLVHRLEPRVGGLVRTPGSKRRA